MKPFLAFTYVVSVVLLFACVGQEKEVDRRAEADVVMQTDTGDVYIKLYDEAPIHKQNFLKLAQEGFYEGMTFHRVVRNFMVQTGNPRTKPNADTKEDDAGYNLPAEISEKFLHTAGKVAAARYPDNVNPGWESSSSEFYIVTGKPVSPQQLSNAEDAYNQAREEKLRVVFNELVDKGEVTSDFNDFLARKNFVNFVYSEEQKAIYAENWGTPNLDFMYTIFGEVVQGMDVVKKIEFVPTAGPYNVPVRDVRIIKMLVLDKDSMQQVINQTQ